MVLTNMFFFNIDFCAFFQGFLRFGVDFGRPQGVQKSQKIAKNRCRDAFGARLGFSYEFGNDFGGILKHFGSISVGFWKDLEGF